MFKYRTVDSVGHRDIIATKTAVLVFPGEAEVHVAPPCTDAQGRAHTPNACSTTAGDE